MQNTNIINLREVRDSQESHGKTVEAGEVFFPLELSVSTKAWIEAAWAALARLPGFKVRQQQIDLCNGMLETILKQDKAAFAAEAPTGTGKTLAYLIASLAIQEATKTPVVIGTATVTLQTQILNYDIPTLVRAGIAKESDFVLAKGRGRYFCLNSAKSFIENGKEQLASGVQGAFDGLQSEKDLLSENLHNAENLYQLYDKKEWDGEQETLMEQGRYKKVWPIVACNSATCLKSQCPEIQRCQFWQAREAISFAKVVIANHNLILNDLELVSLQDIEPAESEENENEKKKVTYQGVFPLPGRYFAVFDEAHHLPEIAASVGATELVFSEIELEIKRAPGLIERFCKAPNRLQLAQKNNLYANSINLGTTLQKIRHLKTLIGTVISQTGTFRIKKDVVNTRVGSTSFGELSAELARELNVINTAMSSVAKMCQTIANKKDQSIAEKSICILMGTEASRIMNLTDSAYKTLVRIAEQSPRKVCWVERDEIRFKLGTQELEGQPILKELLWGQNRVRASAFVSATLVGLGGSFEHFNYKISAPDHIVNKRIKALFKYEQSELHTVQLPFAPGHEKFHGVLSKALEMEVQKDEGNLVLFNSRRSLIQTYDSLPVEIQAMIKSQHLTSVAKAVRAHKEDVDQGKGSILFGLASMAEGLDLPGKYCTHVFITWLPFNSPADPRQEALEELYGKQDYFSKIVLPEATTKLIQMVGRLLRREDDRGRIIIYDKRLCSTRYGSQMLQALPSFEWVLRTGDYTHMKHPHVLRKGILNVK